MAARRAGSRGPRQGHARGRCSVASHGVRIDRDEDREDRDEDDGRDRRRPFSSPVATAVVAAVVPCRLRARLRQVLRSARVPEDGRHPAVPAVPERCAHL